MDRDYRKFVRDTDEGRRLNVSMIPRPVYVEMVKRWRRRPEVIERIAEDGYWLWDLKELERTARAERRQVTWADLAEEIEAEMDDREWWKTTAAFEDLLIEQFPENPSEWADLLDPVYDLQEQDGWIQRQ